MCSAWIEQQKDARTAALPFDERFPLLLDAECTLRENKKLVRNLREAKLRVSQACFEGIDFPPKRELDKATVRGLASCRWVLEHPVIAITGATGTGKSYVACALAHQACRKGYRAVYKHTPRLFDELRLARADGSYQKFLGRLARVDVLVLDDFTIAPIAEQERRDLLEILEDRFDLRATVLTSQLDNSTPSSGTNTSAIRPSPMLSAIDCSRALSGLCYAARRVERRTSSRTNRTHPAMRRFAPIVMTRNRRSSCRGMGDRDARNAHLH